MGLTIRFIPNSLFSLTQPASLDKSKIFPTNRILNHPAVLFNYGPSLPGR
jgi:hypothetical protein